MKNLKDLEFFNYNGHLNDETIALYARSIVSKEDPILLPQPVMAHFEECEQCKTEALDFAEVMTGNYDYQSRLVKSMEEIDKKTEKIDALKIKKFPAHYSGILWIGSMAACLLILFSISWFYWRPVTSEKLFDDYFSPYSNLVTTKGSFSETLAKGMLFYDLKMYDSAVEYFSHALTKDSLNEDVMFYMANAFLVQGKADEAIPLFFNLQNSPDCKYQHPSRWLLGLAWLKADNPENARQVFEQIVNEPNFYSQKAGKILKKLK